MDDVLPSAPTIVVLDVGEVIIDETRVWSVWADICGVSPLTFAAVLGAVIVQGEDWPVTFDVVAPNMVWEELLDEHERRYGGFRDEDVYGDVRGCISELQSSGVTVVIAGNQPEQRTAQLHALALGVETIATSDELGAEKPAAAFYDAVMALAGASSPAEVLYVGDRVDNDVLPAAAYGMRTCWLRRGPWGQLQEPADDTAQPDLVLESLGELPLLLSAWATDTDAD